jgi:hypothetical protein
MRGQWDWVCLEEGMRVTLHYRGDRIPNRSVGHFRAANCYSRPTVAPCQGQSPILSVPIEFSTRCLRTKRRQCQLGFGRPPRRCAPPRESPKSRHVSGVSITQLRPAEKAPLLRLPPASSPFREFQWIPSLVTWKCVRVIREWRLRAESTPIVRNCMSNRNCERSLR